MKKITLLVCLISFFSFLVWADQNENVEEKRQVLTDHRLAANLAGNDGKTFTTLWKNDFDEQATDWTIRGLWSIGLPSQNQKRQSGAVAATNLNGSYADNADYWLISPHVSVGPNVELRLRFRECYKTESYYDYGRVLVSQDNGQTWTAVDARCGYSDWRETSIYLSHYADSQLRIAFNFQSDASFASSGWLIDDVALEYFTRDTLTALMTNLNSQDFPMVYSNVEVEFNGEGLSTLTNANFTVHENGVLQTDLFDVFPPTQGGASRSTDIIFVMDNSGSMSQEQAAVSANVNNFVTSLANAGADVALGLCRFGASQNSGYPIIEDNGNLTTNVDYFRNTVWARNVTSGSTERGFDALCRSAIDFIFRAGSQRIFIIITDEDSDGGNYNYNQALSTLQTSSVTLYGMLDTNNSTIIQHYGTIALATNGAYYNIYSNFTDILNAISTEVASSYLVKYRSSDPILNGVQRNVTVTVSYSGNQATASGSYMPGAAPQIVRTPATINLHNQPSWAAGTQFTIAAQITDAMAPFVQSARVYYKCTSQSTYQYVQMTQSAGNIWSATTPGSAAQAPGFNYYITATDGQTTSSDPSYQPDLYPHTLGISPNVAPVITHTPMTILNDLNQPVVVSTNVIDTTNNVASVVLCYRKTGTITFSEATMSNSGGNDYSGTIPASFATTDGIDYFIRATDDVGVSSRHPVSGHHFMESFDLGFRPNPHGWSFSNSQPYMWPPDWWNQFNYWAPQYINGLGWGDNIQNPTPPPATINTISVQCNSSDFPDWPLYTDAFELSGFLVPILNIWMCWPGAVQRWLSINDIWGGSCYGFSYSSLLNYRFHNDFRSQFPDLGNFNDLYPDLPLNSDDTLDPDIRSCINQLHIYQHGRAQQAHRNELLPTQTPVQTLDDIKQMIKDNPDNPCALSFFNQHRRGGHTVVPYSVKCDPSSSNIEYIYIYDNNYPYDESDPAYSDRMIRVDIANNEWHTDDYLTLDPITNQITDWGGSLGLILELPANTHLSHPAKKNDSLLGHKDVILTRDVYWEIYSTSKCDIELLNSGGQAIGYIGGIQHNELSDGIHIIQTTGTETPPVGYFLPEAQYSVQMNSFDTNNTYLRLFKENEVYAYTRTDCTPSQEDRLTLNGAFTLSSFDPQNKVVQLTAIKQFADHEVEYLIDEFSLGQADSVSIECIADSSLALRYAGNDSGTSSYRLHIQHVDGTQALQFERFNVPIDNNSTHYISPDWGDLDIVPIYIDENNDGTIDEIIYLDNQFDDTPLPVELSSFSATITAQNIVQLNWVSQSETQMQGYLVYRSSSADQGTASLISQQLIPATNTGTMQAYTATDEEVEVGQTYYYWLEALDYASSSYYGPVSVTVNGNTPPALPEVTELRGAYPNPFRALTNIEVALKAGESGEITIYNIHGQAVRKFEVNQGWHKLIWDGKDGKGQSCGSGIYFYKLSTPSLNQTKKMIMVK